MKRVALASGVRRTSHFSSVHPRAAILVALVSGDLPPSLSPCTAHQGVDRQFAELPAMADACEVIAPKPGLCLEPKMRLKDEIAVAEIRFLAKDKGRQPDSGLKIQSPAVKVRVVLMIIVNGRLFEEMCRLKSTSVRTINPPPCPLRAHQHKRSGSRSATDVLTHRITHVLTPNSVLWFCGNNGTRCAVRPATLASFGSGTNWASPSFARAGAYASEPNDTRWASGPAMMTIAPMANTAAANIPMACA